MMTKQVLNERIILQSLSQIYYESSSDLCADLKLWCQKFLLVFNHAYLMDPWTHKGALFFAVTDLWIYLL